MENISLNIKNYADYRDFLKAYYQAKKNHRPKFSYGMWSKQLGLKATSSLTKVINGEREPGETIIEKMNTYFQFDSSQTNYFRDLIRLSKIKNDPRLRMLVMEKMGREHPDARLQILDDKSAEIISHWFCLTIREMVRLQDFQESPEWIKNRLRFEIHENEINFAIKILCHQGLLKRNRAGKLIPSEGLLHTTNDLASEAIKKYHHQMLQNAQLALRNARVEEREFTSETLTINASRIPEAKELIREFKAKFARLFEEQIGNETYQFQIQLFPLTKDDK